MQFAKWLVVFIGMASIHVLHGMEGGASPQNPRINSKKVLIADGREVQIKIDNKKNKYKFGAPDVHDDFSTRGEFFKNGSQGYYIVIKEQELEGNYYYFLLSDCFHKNKRFFNFWLANLQNGQLHITYIENGSLPGSTERLQSFIDNEQYELIQENNVQAWISYGCPTIQTDWGLWLIKTTPGKCISGIAGLLMLYGSGRILWDTQAQWKKGSAYLLSLLKKMLIKKRKRREKGQKKITPLQERA